jgi:hypothetical protein
MRPWSDETKKSFFCFEGFIQVDAHVMETKKKERSGKLHRKRTHKLKPVEKFNDKKFE